MKERLWRLVLVLPLAFASTSRAEDWREFKRSDQIVGALNVGDAKRDGSIVNVAMLLAPKAQPLAPLLMYTIIEVRADCDARTAQFLGAQNFAGAVPMGAQSRPDPASTQSKGEELQPLCNMNELKQAGVSTALEFVRIAWSTR